MWEEESPVWRSNFGLISLPETLDDGEDDGDDPPLQVKFLPPQRGPMQDLHFHSLNHSSSIFSRLVL